MGDRPGGILPPLPAPRPMQGQRFGLSFSSLLVDHSREKYRSLFPLQGIYMPLGEPP